jgi:hypothetical protein
MPEPDFDQTTHEITQVLRAIADIKQENPKQAEGTTPCPRCGGTIWWYASTPRFARIKCQTPHCISVMS